MVEDGHTKDETMGPGAGAGGEEGRRMLTMSVGSDSLKSGLGLLCQPVVACGASVCSESYAATGAHKRSGLM